MNENRLDPRSEEKDKILILASYGAFSLGINIRNRTMLYLVVPYKSRIKVLQSIDRGLRKSEQKDAATIWYKSDDLTYKNPKLHYYIFKNE